MPGGGAAVEGFYTGGDREMGTEQWQQQRILAQRQDLTLIELGVGGSIK